MGAFVMPALDMMNRFNKPQSTSAAARLAVAAAAATTLMALAAPAAGSLVLNIQSGTQTLSIADNSAADVDTNTGEIVYVGTVNGFRRSIITALLDTDAVTGLPTVELSALEVTDSTAGQRDVTISLLSPAMPTPSTDVPFLNLHNSVQVTLATAAAGDTATYSTLASDPSTDINSDPLAYVSTGGAAGTFDGEQNVALSGLGADTLYDLAGSATLTLSTGAQAFFTSASAVQVVPEPTAGPIVVLGLLAVLGKRRRRSAH
jgi:hypothetical protein